MAITRRRHSQPAPTSSSDDPSIVVEVSVSSEDVQIGNDEPSVQVRGDMLGLRLHHEI